MPSVTTYSPPVVTSSGATATVSTVLYAKITVDYNTVVANNDRLRTVYQARAEELAGLFGGYLEPTTTSSVTSSEVSTESVNTEDYYFPTTDGAVLFAQYLGVSPQTRASSLSLDASSLVTLLTTGP